MGHSAATSCEGGNPFERSGATMSRRRYPPDHPAPPRRWPGHRHSQGDRPVHAGPPRPGRAADSRKPVTAWRRAAIPTCAGPSADSAGAPDLHRRTSQSAAAAGFGVDPVDQSAEVADAGGYPDRGAPARRTARDGCAPCLLGAARRKRAEPHDHSVTKGMVRPGHRGSPTRPRRAAGPTRSHRSSGRRHPGSP